MGQTSSYLTARKYKAARITGLILNLQQLATRLSLKTHQLPREWETQKFSSYHNHRSAIHHLATV